MAMDPLSALGAKIGGGAAVDENTEVQRGIDYVFALELLKAMQAGSIDDSQHGAFGSGPYKDMVTESLASTLAASGGLGFGRYMVKQLESRQAAIAQATAEAQAVQEASDRIPADVSKTLAP